MRDYDMYFGLSDCVSENGEVMKESELTVGMQVSFEVVEEKRNNRLRAVRIQVMSKDMISGTSSMNGSLLQMPTLLPTFPPSLLPTPTTSTTLTTAAPPSAEYDNTAQKATSISVLSGGTVLLLQVRIVRAV